MVFMRSFVGLAALANLVSAAPVLDRRTDMMDSMGMGMGMGMDKMGDSACAGGDCGMMATSSAMAEATMACSGGDCGMMATSSAMAEATPMACSGGDCGMMATSSAMAEATPMACSSGDCGMMTSSAMAEATSMACSSGDCGMQTMSSEMAMSTAMATSAMSPMYGSGSSNWGGSGYEGCVQQCMASYGAPAATYTPSATTTMGSYGSGATHKVVVAPTQGVLRFVPFAVNASVGDTVEFMWGANNHTVTKSSQLAPCNKTTDALFASGEQNKSFVFSQKVNDTNATFYYCATTGHCQKGMFGIINPPNADAASGMTVASMMSSMTANSSYMSALWSYTKNVTANNTMAANWGMGMDMSSMESWAQEAMMENVMYTQMFLAMNPESMKDDGTVDLSNVQSMMLPQDISAIAQNAVQGSSSASAGSPAATGSGSAGSAGSSGSSASSGAAAAEQSGTASSAISGAGSVASSSVMVGLTAGLAAFFLL